MFRSLEVHIVVALSSCIFKAQGTERPEMSLEVLEVVLSQTLLIFILTKAQLHYIYPGADK